MMGQASLWGEQAQEQPADVVAGDGDRLRRPGRGHRLPVEPLERLVEGGPGVAAAEADLLVGGAGLQEPPERPLVAGDELAPGPDRPLGGALQVEGAVQGERRARAQGRAWRRSSRSRSRTRCRGR